MYPNSRRQKPSLRDILLPAGYLFIPSSPGFCLQDTSLLGELT